MSETALQNKIRLEIGKLKDARLFRNNVGSAKTYDGRHIDFGLCVGSSDLIGFKSVTITPEMVGQNVAIFTAIEVKTPTGKVSKIQENFISMVKKHGGIAAVVRTIDDATDILK
jgi:hypothetical protein